MVVLVMENDFESIFYCIDLVVVEVLWGSWRW